MKEGRQYSRGLERSEERLLQRGSRGAVKIARNHKGFCTVNSAVLRNLTESCFCLR